MEKSDVGKSVKSSRQSVCQGKQRGAGSHDPDRARRCGIFFRLGLPSGEQPFLRIDRLIAIQRMKTFVTAIRQQSSRLNIIPKSDGENVIYDDVSPLRMKHGKENFHRPYGPLFL